MKAFCITVFLIYTFFVSLVRGQNLRDKEKQVKDQILGRPYDGTILPRNNSNPVDIVASLQLQNQLTVDGQQRAVQVHLLLKLEWNEPRFVYTTFPPNSGPYQLTLPSSALDSAWTPDIYFENSEKTDYESRYMKVYPNGNVLYTALVKVTFLCPMNLKRFPHDVQNCELRISSFAYNANEMRLQWKESDPVSIAFNLYAPDFVLQKVATDVCDPEVEESTDNKSCIRLGLTIKRTWFSSFLVLVYIPFTNLIIVSWLSYFLHPVRSATARLGTAIAALGLGIIGATSLNFNLPRATYTKSIDVWTGISLTFIFLAVVEFVVVNYLNQYARSSSNSSRDHRQIQDTSDAAEQQAPLNPRGDDKSASQIITQETSKLGATIDIVFRIAIPILYVLFVIVYWLTLT